MTDETQEIIENQVETQETQEQEAQHEPTQEELIEERAKQMSQKRIDKLVAQRENEKRAREQTAAEVAALRLELERFKATAKPVNQYDPDAPKPEAYELGKFDPDYIRDAAKHEAIKYLTEQQNNARLSEKANHLSKIEKEFSKTTPDYIDVVEEFESSPIANVEAFRDIINESDNPAQIKYYLGKNPDELEKLGEMTVTQAMRYIGRIEAKLEEQSPPVEAKKQVSTAPKPITPVKGASPAVIKDPAKMTMDEYAAFRRTQK